MYPLISRPCLACEKPVVSTPLREVVRIGKSVVEFGENSDSFAQSVETLLNQPGKCQAIGRLGRQLVVTKYDWNRLAIKYESVLQNVLGLSDN